MCDYCQGADRLDPFFVGRPDDPTAVDRVIRARQSDARPHAAIARMVVEQLKTRGAPRQAVAAAECLAEKQTIAVVTGQQAGLFGGPLFTLLKALTAVRLAHTIGQDRGVPTVAVFWVDAEDHDLAEVSSCGVLTGDLEFRRISLPHASDNRHPVSNVPLPDAVDHALDELRSLLPATEFTGHLLEQLTDIYRPGTGFAEAFSRLLDTVLGPQGLIVFDASDRAAKPLVSTIFGRELDGRGETSRLASAAGQELEALGYHAQVAPTPDTVAMFRLDRERKAIRLRDDGFEIGSQSVTADQARRDLQEHPDGFGPNVLLRPIIQDTLFPTVTYVAGPSELAYLGQLRRVYEQFDVPMPVIFPRATATIVDRATLRFLSRYDVGFETLQAQDDAVLNRLLAALLPAAVEDAVSAANRAVSDRMDAIGAQISAVDPTLVGAVETTRGRMERDLRNLYGKIVQAAKRRDQTLRRQFTRARSQAFPQGHPQERAVGLVYFLNLYGPHLVDRLAADLPMTIGKHWLLTV